MRDRADFDELVDAWWASRRAIRRQLIDVDDDVVVDGWHAYVFGSILTSCGWTTDEWNAVVDDVKHRGER